jgi:hypothetical protein
MDWVSQDHPCWNSQQQDAKDAEKNDCWQLVHWVLRPHCQKQRDEKHGWHHQLVPRMPLSVAVGSPQMPSHHRQQEAEKHPWYPCCHCDVTVNAKSEQHDGLEQGDLCRRLENQVLSRHGRTSGRQRYRT